METDFAALRQYLEGAWLQARGNDEVTRRIRGALDVLIEDALHAEHSRPSRLTDLTALRQRRRAS